MKRIIFYLSIIFINLRILFADVDVGIIGALEEEIKNLKKEMAIEKKVKIGQFVFYKGRLEDKCVVLAKSGIGKVKSAVCATLLITCFDPRYVIFTGVAGAINKKIKIGDIIISRDLIYHDFGKITPKGFVPWAERIQTDKRLLKLATKSIKDIKLKRLPKKLSKIKRFPKVYIGRVITGDQFIAFEKKRKDLEDKFKADVVEMEGASVADVCRLFNKPFLVIKVASDLANETAQIDFDTFCKYVAPLTTSIIKNLLRYHFRP